MARPMKEIDKEFFEKLCGLQCTLREFEFALDVSRKTLLKWCKATYNESFSTVFGKKRQAGFISLRRAQFRLAEKSAAMAIFLGKNYLGQTDKDSWQRQQEEKALQLKEKTVEQKDW